MEQKRLTRSAKGPVDAAVDEGASGVYRQDLAGGIVKDKRGIGNRGATATSDIT